MLVITEAVGRAHVKGGVLDTIYPLHVLEIVQDKKKIKEKTYKAAFTRKKQTITQHLQNNSGESGMTPHSSLLTQLTMCSL